MPAFRPTPLVNAAFRATPRAAINRPASQAHVGSISTQYVFKWVSSLFFWGFSGSVILTLALSGVPLFKHDVLNKTPLVAFYEDKTPPEDKPF